MEEPVLITSGSNFWGNYHITGTPTVMLIGPNKEILRDDIFPRTVDNISSILETYGVGPTSLHDNLLSGTIGINPIGLNKENKLKLNVALSSFYNIKVTDLRGKVYLDHQKYLSSGIKEICISDNTLSQKIYLIQINSKNKTKTFKIFR